MGVCICVAFLRTVAVPNVRVATVILLLDCCYDVFFVFVSPLVFGSSVMDDVATDGPAAYTKRGYRVWTIANDTPRMRSVSTRNPFPCSRFSRACITVW
ncbi:hypothetical protein PsorP6_006932 [Peronosclerospora sorghi]|uniref:Uncharacterized protein n=1 Tax=Peronosclerospora sorghi TaxID=230839 RepID=A0ACC0W950_9STRA|nr:hypothetical protein PsorP6_006932 [Peronosclerospora sorghi]